MNKSLGLFVPIIKFCSTKKYIFSDRSFYHIVQSTGAVEYTDRFGVVEPDRVLSMGQVELNWRRMLN